MCLGAIYWARPERVYYACTKDDAADSGFDDSFIYKEIVLDGEQRSIPFENHREAGAGEDGEQRSIPFENHREAGAGEEFRLWESSSDKTPY